MLESTYAYIKDADGWETYCCKFDEKGRPFDYRKITGPPVPYKFAHENEPSEYPCLVQSDLQDDPNGPYYYSHHFVYLVDAAKLVQASLVDLIEERDYYKNELIRVRAKEYL
jgi:hypothetical protein